VTLISYSPTVVATSKRSYEALVLRAWEEDRPPRVPVRIIHVGKRTDNCASVATSVDEAYAIVSV
jgi:hypothetical protein